MAGFPTGCGDTREGPDPPLLSLLKGNVLLHQNQGCGGSEVRASHPMVHDIAQSLLTLPLAGHTLLLNVKGLGLVYLLLRAG